MGRLIPVVLLVGCVPRAPVDNGFPDTDLETPVIEFIELVCDAERGKWEMTLKATAWTGGAASAWTIDGEYVETHKLSRKNWKADGTGETLEMSLSIAEDFRDVGGGTLFTCSTDPNGVLVLYDTLGYVSDCRSWGPEPEIFDSVPDTPAACDTLLDVP